MAVTHSTSAAAHTQAKYDVGGVLLDRPFKIRRLGHFGFNFTHLDEALRFYTDLRVNGADSVARWPATVDARPDTFMGEAFLGPWA